MNAEGYVLRAAEEGETESIRSLLKKAGLPFEDVTPGRQSLIVASRGHRICGCAGLERYGRYGLLRSLAVEDSSRGQGLGQALAGKMIDAAREAGVGELYLLTLTADRFFEKLGFDRVSRTAAPDALQNTTEFHSLCPASSVCMRLKI